eukprot:CAMPEP_0204278024 /NCGR_PEP_ID=MMETSP0468-20130131/29636_1 /ASSEMBLY_ACC=CAM_ASM_000383 /TAXON_ID=2969 /ORGANISM="Oxyrrhis marina" /LENGTH=220 /DNA_ID=CAMNT_0051254883 /DNA_START=8 /DNA_END=670 /DNA_ORIENTATION=-
MTSLAWEICSPCSLVIEGEPDAQREPAGQACGLDAKDAVGIRDATLEALNACHWDKTSNRTPRKGMPRGRVPPLDFSRLRRPYGTQMYPVVHSARSSCSDVSSKRTVSSRVASARPAFGGDDTDASVSKAIQWFTDNGGDFGSMFGAPSARVMLETVPEDDIGDKENSINPIPDFKFVTARSTESSKSRSKWQAAQEPSDAALAFVSRGPVRGKVDLRSI